MRAGDEVRTRDLQLGRLSLYQLSYSRLLTLVGREGFEPSKEYTNRFTVCPRWPLEYLPYFFPHAKIKERYKALSNNLYTYFKASPEN